MPEEECFAWSTLGSFHWITRRQELSVCFWELLRGDLLLEIYPMSCVVPRKGMRSKVSLNSYFSVIGASLSGRRDASTLIGSGTGDWDGVDCEGLPQCRHIKIGHACITDYISCRDWHIAVYCFSQSLNKYGLCTTNWAPALLQLILQLSNNKLVTNRFFCQSCR